jgi:hypothetical protein
MEMMFPIGTIASSGTPLYYSEFPGLSPTNNKVIQFGPQPDASFSGSNFIVHYKKRQEDLVLDTDVQSVIPEQWQYLITYYFAEKVLDFRQDPKSNIFRAKKEEMMTNMKMSDWNQPNQIRNWKDYNYRNGTASGRSMYDTSANVYLP